MSIETSPVRRATYADIDELPETVVGELIDGVLYTSPRPAPRHAYTSSYVLAELLQRFGQGRGSSGGWLILIEPELRIDGNVLVPDIAGWRRSTIADADLEASAISVAPDLVVEVASPNTALLDRQSKMPRYHKMGVGHIWLVSPDTNMIEVFRHAPDGWYMSGVFGEETNARIEPFVAAELDLSGWFLRKLS